MDTNHHWWLVAYFIQRGGRVIQSYLSIIIHNKGMSTFKDL